MYEEHNDGGVDVFLRPDDPGHPVVQETRRRSGSSSMLMILNVLLVVIMIGAAGGVVWYLYQPEIRISTPVEESLPFQRTADYLATYDEIVTLTGPSPTVRDAGDTNLDWSIDGSGQAMIHVVLEGTEGRIEAFVDWEREQDAWGVKSANFLLPGGERKAIPLGSGSFLSAVDLSAWRRADESTAIGRGQRELIQGQRLQAIQMFNEAIKENPEDTEALLWRGRAFEALGNFQRALADYQRILSFDPEHAHALARLDALRASPPPGAPEVEQPEREEPKKVYVPAPVDLIPED